MKFRDTNHDADFHDLCPLQVGDFPCGEVSVKVGVMEFGLYRSAFPSTKSLCLPNLLAMQVHNGGRSMQF